MNEKALFGRCCSDVESRQLPKNETANWITATFENTHGQPTNFLMYILKKPNQQSCNIYTSLNW